MVDPKISNRKNRDYAVDHHDEIMILRVISYQVKIFFYKLQLSFGFFFFLLVFLHSEIKMPPLYMTCNYVIEVLILYGLECCKSLELVNSYHNKEKA